MRLVAHRYSNSRYFIYFWSIFFSSSFPWFPHSELMLGVAAVIFSPHSNIGCYENVRVFPGTFFSRAVSAPLASTSRITENTIHEPEESSQNVSPAMSHIQRCRQGQGQDYIAILWKVCILWSEAEPGKSVESCVGSGCQRPAATRGCGKFHYSI